ncbi:MAG: M67 family metallopeptidase [Firmicutes bacterium]|nr:M67 family metallopeptidase [Bacillota bacterium]
MTSPAISGEPPLGLRINRETLDAVIAHCREEAPREGCGLLAGREGQGQGKRQGQGPEAGAESGGEASVGGCGGEAAGIHTVNSSIRMTNTDRSERTYMMDPAEQFQAFKEMRKRKEDLVGIYHSHPASPAYPSPTDVRLAYYPDAVYLIVSLSGREPEARAFRIRDERITEIPIMIVDEMIIE